MKIFTPAKINPLLHILRKRTDGFHDLYMHMVPVGLYDILEFSNINFGKLNFRMKGAKIFVETDNFSFDFEQNISGKM